MSEPRVRFCPFCGSGTLFIDPDNVTGYGCMKCKRGFQVGIRTDAAPPERTAYLNPDGAIPIDELPQKFPDGRGEYR